MYVGMLSKSKGQILRVAAVLHVLFHVENPHIIPSIVGDAAVKAAINFVDLCVQHAAYITGRGRIQDEIESVHQIMQGIISYAVVLTNQHNIVCRARCDEINYTLIIKSRRAIISAKDFIPYCSQVFNLILDTARPP